MAHLVDSLTWTGETPWHGLGRKLPKHATVEDMIRFGGLDWQVIPRPLFQADENGQGASIPGMMALTRSDRPSVTLACVSEGYGIVQNDEALALAEATVGESNASAEVCGALDEGRRIFVVLNLAEAGFDIAGERIEPYVVCYSGHDGSTSVGFKFTPVRVVCQNTLDASLNGQGAAFTIRHTRNAAERVKRAAEAIAQARAYFGTFHQQALALVKQTLRIDEAVDIAHRLFPNYKNGKGEVIIPANKGKLFTLFERQEYNTDRKIAGTKWGFYNAVTALVDHNTRGQGRRMARALGTSEIKDKAMGMLLAA